LASRSRWNHCYVFGWLWYSPKLFGKRWAEGSGVSPEPPEKMPIGSMAAQVFSLFVLASVIGLTAAVNALITAILAILAVAFFTLSGGLWSQKSGYALRVDFFYVIISGVLMIVCQGVF
jgi:hypothetical protein